MEIMGSRSPQNEQRVNMPEQSGHLATPIPSTTNDHKTTKWDRPLGVKAARLMQPPGGLGSQSSGADRVGAGGAQ